MATTNVKRLAIETLDTQLKFIKYYKSREGKLSLMYYMDSIINKGQMDPGELDPIEYAGQSGMRIAQELAETLGQASTFYLTEEMFALNMKAAEQIPIVTFREEDLPTDSGFILLPRPLITVDVNDQRMSARVLVWWKSTIRVPVKVGDTDKMIAVPCLMYCLFSNKSDVDTDDAIKSARDDRPDLWPRWPQWQLAHWTFLFFDNASGHFEGSEQRFELEAKDGIAEATKEMDEWVRKYNFEKDGTQVGSFYAFLKSFFLLVKQRIAAPQPVNPGKSSMARWASAGLSPEYGEIQIVTLRRKRPSSVHEIEGNSEDWINWSHRWLVSGHWHNYWVGSDDDRHLEPRWVEAYEKVQQISR